MKDLKKFVAINNKLSNEDHSENINIVKVQPQVIHKKLYHLNSINDLSKHSQSQLSQLILSNLLKFIYKYKERISVRVLRYKSIYILAISFNYNIKY